MNDLFLRCSIACNPKLREPCPDSLVTKSMLESADPNYGHQASESSCWDLLKSLILCPLEYTVLRHTCNAYHPVSEMWEHTAETVFHMCKMGNRPVLDHLVHFVSCVCQGCSFNITPETKQSKWQSHSGIFPHI